MKEPLLEDLAALPTEAAPARDLWPEIAARLDGEAGGAGPVRRFPAARLAAAAVLIFACGLALGLALGQRRSAPEATALAPAQKGLASAARVQRAGSAYIAALAELRGSAREADPAAVRQGRDAALAALRGAAEELRRLAPDHPGAARLQREAEAAHRGERMPADAAQDLTWF